MLSEDTDERRYPVTKISALRELTHKIPRRSRLIELADKLPGRRKGDHDRPKKDKDRDRDREDKDRSEEDRGWEQALALATLVTEEHDLKDTPVEMLIPLLNNTIAVKFSEVTSYKADSIKHAS